MRLVLAPRAEEDLDDLWVYIATESGSEPTATRVLRSVADALLLIAKFPHLGRSRDLDLKSGYRSFPVNNYVIFYRIRPGVVQVIRILHGSRDVQELLGDAN